MAEPSEGWHDLVDELRLLESFLPMLGKGEEQSELEEEVDELRLLILTARDAKDEQSRKALDFLVQELERKEAMLERLGGATGR